MSADKTAQAQRPSDLVITRDFDAQREPAGAGRDESSDRPDQYLAKAGKMRNKAARNGPSPDPHFTDDLIEAMS